MSTFSTPPSSLALLSLTLASLPLLYLLHSTLTNPPTLKARRKAIDTLVAHRLKHLGSTPEKLRPAMRFTSVDDGSLKEVMEDVLVNGLTHVTAFHLHLADIATDQSKSGEGESLLATFSLRPVGEGEAASMTFDAPFLTVLLPAILSASASAPPRSSCCLFVSDATSGSLSSFLPTLPLSSVGVLPIDTGTFLPLLSHLRENGQVSVKTLKDSLTALTAFTSRSPLATKETKTFLFSLCGLSHIPALLPAAFEAFPHDRHLFVYDNPLHLPPSASLKTSPLPLSPSPSPTLANLLLSLPLPLHLTTASWLLAVNAFWTVKDETNADTMFGTDMADEKAMTKGERRERRVARRLQRNKPEYLPLVVKFDDLKSNKSGESGGGEAVRVLLEFMSGRRSQGIPPAALELSERAQSALSSSSSHPPPTLLSPSAAAAVEECVFADKRVLICGKTLPDTVKISNDWSLKASRKATRCGCCGPPESDSEDSESEEGGGGGGAGGGGGQWMDGKSGFAFDPGAAVRRAGMRGRE